MPAHILQDRRRLTLALMLLGITTFYLITLAPTVLWGDDAFLQRAAYEGAAPPNSPARWPWLMLARLAVHLPIGDVAFRANLLSALCAAVAVILVLATARALSLSRWASVIVALALAVSHTFWMHAVRAEVYTLFLALVALELLLWFRWQPGRPWPMRLAMLLFGLLLLAHPLAVLLLPAWAWLLWRRRRWITAADLLGWVVAGTAGLALFLWVALSQAPGVEPARAILPYFTSSGSDFSGALFRLSWTTLPRDLFVWLGFLGLQFPSPAGLLIIAALVQPRRWAGVPEWQTLGLLYLTGVAFAMTYRVNDQFVFYLPSYVAIVFFAGLGWDGITAALPRLAEPRTTAVVTALVVVLPPLVYLLAFQIVSVFDLNPLHVRDLPGREPGRFFLWPAKNGYDGARTYGSAALNTLPPESLLVADYTPMETVLYLQSVEGLRTDVTVAQTGPGYDLKSFLAGQPAGREIYFADNNPAYYNLSDLPGARLEPEGVVYRFVPAGESSPGSP